VIRAALIDDEPLVRAGLRTILESDADIEVVAEGGDGRTAVEVVDRYQPDILLLDIQMPGVDGLTVAETVRARHPGVRIVIVTTFGEDRYIARALDAGVDGFLLKSADPYELITGAKAAVSGGTALSPTVARWLVASLHRGDLQRRLAAQADIATLTPRERDVLALLGAGLSNAQIGRRLHLVEGTVKIHVSAILGKLHLDNRVQAAILAHEAGLTYRAP
jgi:DNA-binding NarL/FixJ family response regulator